MQNKFVIKGGVYMFYNVLELKDLVDFKENLFDKRLLLERGESSLTAIALKKHEVLENHIHQHSLRLINNQLSFCYYFG